MKKIIPQNQRQWRNFFSKFGTIITTVAVIYLIFLSGYYAGRSSFPIVKDDERIVNTEVGKPRDIDFSVYWEAWNKLQNKTASSLDTEKLIQNSIAGLLSAADDPYTVYFSPEENKRFREDISGEFGGIGVEIVQKNGLPTVVAPLSGTPAEKAGLKPGDIVMAVDGTDTTTIGFDETINKIRGVKGTEVALKLAREGASEPIEVRVTRDTIVVKSTQLDYKEFNGKKVAVITLRQFGDDTSSLFADAVKDIRKNTVEGVVIDLRNNPGGYLETAVDLASYFVDGVIVSEKGKNNSSKEYKANHKSQLKGVKLTVLVNKGSASASEIFSGAIQDHSAGKIIGEKTFGKGSVQELIDLSDGAAIKVTIADWYTPAGRQITKQGIEPDILVEASENTEDDNQLNRALQLIVESK